ncbi:MAG: sugar phosphate isomerase/epimerase [Candidatus Aenigmatarchaeota archaeon]
MGLEERIKEFEKISFNFIEIGSYSVEELGAEKVKEIIFNSTLKPISYHAVLNYFLDEELDTYEHKMVEALELAKFFNVNLVSFHPGRFKNNREKARESLVMVLNETVRKSKNTNITLAVENMAQPDKNNLIMTANEIDYFLKNVPELKLCLDVSNATQMGIDVVDFAKKFKDKIVALHMSDAFLYKKDAESRHLPLGKGEINFPKLVEVFKNEDIKYILEIRFSHGLNEIASSKSYLQSLIVKTFSKNGRTGI